MTGWEYPSRDTGLTNALAHPGREIAAEAYTNSCWVVSVSASNPLEYGSGKLIDEVEVSHLAQHCVCSIWLHCALAVAARRSRSSGSTPLLVRPDLLEFLDLLTR
jgi:hypothetical protein